MAELGCDVAGFLLPVVWLEIGLEIGISRCKIACCIRTHADCDVVALLTLEMVLVLLEKTMFAGSAEEFL